MEVILRMGIRTKRDIEKVQVTPELLGEVTRESAHWIPLQNKVHQGDIMPYDGTFFTCLNCDRELHEGDSAVVVRSRQTNNVLSVFCGDGCRKAHIRDVVSKRK